MELVDSALAQKFQKKLRDLANEDGEGENAHNAEFME